MLAAVGKDEVVGRLLIVTGPPGAGKSTVAQLMARRAELSVLVEGDAFFGFLATGAIAPWLPESATQNETVTRAAGAATGELVRGGFTVVYDGVLGPWHVDEFLRAAHLRQADYAVLLPPVDVCVQRVAERRGHGFTDESATRHMHDQFNTRSSDGRYLLRDPPDAPEAVSDLIDERRASGQLAYQASGAFGRTS